MPLLVVSLERTCRFCHQRSHRLDGDSREAGKGPRSVGAAASPDFRPMKATNSVISISHNLLGSGPKSAPNRTEYLPSFPRIEAKGFQHHTRYPELSGQSRGAFRPRCVLHSDVPCRYDLHHLSQMRRFCSIGQLHDMKRRSAQIN